MSREFEKEKLNMLLEEGDWDSLLEEDDDFDAVVKEEYIKEAEEIERSLFPEGISQEPPASEAEIQASYERLVALMKKKGIYREDPVVDEAAVDGASVGDALVKNAPEKNAAADGALVDSAAVDGAVGKNAVMDNAAENDGAVDSAAENGAAADASGGSNTMAFAGSGLGFVPGTDGTAGVRMAANLESAQERSRRAMHRQFKMVRAAGIAVACLMGVLLATMTSEASRTYVVQTVKYFMGNGAYVTADSDNENDKTQRDEAEIREEIENAIGVKVPEIMHRPDTFELYNYDIFREISTASIEYMYNGNIVTLDIYNCDSDLTSKNLGWQGDEQAVFYIEEENIKVSFTEIIDEAEKLPSYTAEWERENVRYQFSGRMEKEIFEDIIKSMKYY